MDQETSRGDWLVIAVCLIDTSVFVEILNVPGLAANHERILDELQSKTEQGEVFLLPMATLIETGNHIGQNGDGNQRRQCSQRFAEQVRLALTGQSPFKTMDFPEAEMVGQWLDEFPNWAAHGSGLGDLSIKHDWELQCDLNRARRVYIWSLAHHLAAFDRNPIL